MLAKIQKLLAMFFAAVLLAVAPPSLAEGEWCGFEAAVTCFGLNWNTATPDKVRRWLNNGGDVAKTFYGMTPLHYAVDFNTNPEVITALIDGGANVNAKNREDETPLHFAAAKNANFAVITALIDASADVTAEDNYGRTPLHWAASSSENPAIITALINSDANVNAKDKGGETPLHLAAESGQFKNAKALIAAGADVNALDFYANTPIDNARANSFGADSLINQVIKDAGGGCNKQC